MNNKIKDNPTFKDLQEHFEAMAVFTKLLSFASKLKLTNKSIEDWLVKFPQFRDQLDEFLYYPDKFNERFSKLGWIVSETSDFNLVKQCVNTVREEEANQKLIYYFSQNENLKWRITAMQGIMQFQPRLRIVELALNDYAHRRYHSTIPILLFTIDGLINQVQGKGFHAEVDIRTFEVSDSISGHQTGLATLQRLYTKTRYAVNDQEIKIPYRHGILHGTDINYDNQEVAAKLWAALFAVGDWIRAKDNINNQKLSDKLEWWELMKQLRANKLNKKLLAEWSPRVIKIGKDVPPYGKTDSFIENTPERKLAEYFEYLVDKNYGKLVSTVANPTNRPFKVQAGVLRELYQEFNISRFMILNIHDEAAGVTEIETEIEYTSNISNDSNQSKKTFRLLYQDKACRPRIRGDFEGKWIVFNYGVTELNKYFIS